MPISELVGKAQTVLGPVATKALGITLPHEHLLCDMSVRLVEPATNSEKVFFYQPISLENRGLLDYNATKNLDNMRLWDEDVAKSEVLRFKEAGGSTIVDVTNTDMGRDPLALQRIARATGLNIIMGSGYYVGPGHPPELASKTEGEITEEIIRDITVGVGDTGVRAGLIGEIGCSYPLTDGERKVLRAAACAQQETGAPVTVHPGRPYPDSPFEITEVLAEAGGNLKRTVISHIDMTITDVDRVGQLVESGCYVEYDLFGRLGRILHPVEFIDMPSDGQRVGWIKQLILQGYLNQILISQDICMKMRLIRYGGHGYAHILNYVVPLMRAKGITEEQIHTLLVENPKRLLQFVTPTTETP